MRQRVKLAQALAHDPQLLFLDEPTNGLDPAGREEMLDLVARTGHTFGIPILMSSHLLGEIERVCDHLVVIDAGRLVNTGRIADFTDLTRVVAIEVERDADRVAAALTARGVEAHAEGRVVEARVEADGHGEAEANGRLHATIVEVVADLSVPLVRLERRRRSLEDLFQPTKGAPADASADSGS